MKRKVITVDGLAASGKSALAHTLAEKIGYVNFSSGLIYRALGFLALKEGKNCDKEEQLLELLRAHSLRFIRSDKGDCQLELDGKALGKELFAPAVSEATSKGSRHRRVREALLDLQRSAFAGQNLVAEGRDMGTVVFPDADLKFFIKASEEVRVERRIRQITRAKTAEIDLNLLKRDIQIEIHERDMRDLNRPDSPAIPAKDALVIDNSQQTLTAVIEYMYDAVLKKGLIEMTS